MGVQLGSGVALDRPRRVVLEGRGGEFACGLRRADVADPRLGVPLQLAQGYPNTLAMRFPHPLVAAYKRGQRDRLWRGEGRIPPGPVLDGRDLLAVLAFVGLRHLMADQLLFRVRMLAFAQSGEMLGTDRPRQTPLAGQSALPLAVTLLILAPVVLLLRRELALVIGLRLAGGERFRDREHG